MVLILLVPSEADIGNPIITMTGSNKEDRFGWNVSNAGDVNRDGYDDIIVGAPGYDNARGRVYIFFGGPWFSGELKDEYANITINGSVQGERFGWDVAYAGDVNNDGADDVIVGAPGNKSETGAVYIYYGQSYSIATVKVQKANQTLTGEGPGDEFGSSVSGAGDVNADGFDDVIVGAPGHDGKTGKAFIFLGNSYAEKQLKADKAEVMFWGEKLGDCFGFSVSRAGNVNRDAYDDVIIGAPGADKTYVFMGGDPMNAWIQSTEEDFDSAQTRVHVNTTRIMDGEVRLDTFKNVKIMTAYYDGSNPPDTPQIPRSRTWDQQIWNSEIESNGFGSDSNNWFVIKSGSVRKNEKILGVSDAAKDINIQISDGLSWSHSMELAGTIRDVKYRGFDVAYESLSGNALIAYSNDSSPTKQIPKYRIWNGTEWSAEMDTQAVGTADIHWIVLASNPLSDEILMVTLDRANKDIYAQVWNGSAWGNVVLIESDASRDDTLCFDVAYEQQTGFGMILWAGDIGGNKNLNYRRWKGDSGNWSEAQVNLVPADNQVNWVRLAADPKTNYILIGTLDNGKEIDAQVWNGSAWSPREKITTIAERNLERCFDIAWEAKGDRKGLIVYGINDHRPAYRNVTGTSIGPENLVLDALSPDNGRKPNWIVLKSDPQSRDIMLMYLVDDGGGNGGAEDDIGAELWNGSGWGYPMRIEYNSTRDNGISYDFAYTDTSGYFTSAAFDAKNTASWGRILWTGQSPLQTTMKIRTRTSPDGATWSLWSDWYDKYNRIKSPKNRWIQYQVYFETANVTLTPELYDIHIELNHANITIDGATGECFGWSVSYAGDFDNDSYDDIIIGAPQNESGQGAAYIFHGKMLVLELEKDGYLSLSSGESPNVTLSGQSEGDLFGYSVSFAGNVNGDAHDDIIVGAPNFQKSGAVYVFLGTSSWPSKIESMRASYIFTEENEIDCFGWSVSYAGHVINTTAGCDEMLVGAPLFDALPNENSGKAYIFHLYYQPDLLIDGEINDEYQEIPSGPQYSILYIPEGENATWWILLENDGNLNDAFDFIIDPIMPVGWSWELTENSTGLLIINGDSVHLAPGESNNYTLRISSTITAMAGDECWITINICSQNNTFKKDSVKGLVHIIDVTPPRITDTTIGFPSTGDLYTISANVTDNMALDEVHLYYWFDLYGGGTDGPHKVLMDPGFVKVINVPVEGIKLHYNISANDTSDNRNETGITQIDVIDNDIPTISDSTVGFPTTGDPFTITAFVTDNILVNEVYLYYWFDLRSGETEGPFKLIMDPGLTKDIDVPHNSTSLHYNITANDTSDNWNETGITTISVLDNDLPILVDITSVYPTTGDIFAVWVYASDNIQVANVHVFFWLETTGGFIAPLNRSMGDVGSGYYEYDIYIPSNALVLHYKIFANDTSDNLNETGFLTIEVTDNDGPDIIDTTIGLPATGDTYTITASVSDNMGVVEVRLHYWLDLYGGDVDGPYNILMDIGYSKIINIPTDAIMLHYNISANDTSNNWNKTNEKAISVEDNDFPNIADTTFDIPTTGESFAVTAQVIDNICLDEVHLYLWFETTYGFTAGQNYSMNSLGEGDYEYLMIVPANALMLHYNISANDTSDNWGEIGLVSLGVLDNDLPQINGLSANPSIQEAWQAVNITVNIIDEIGVNVPWINITYPDGNWENKRMDKGGEDQWYLDKVYWLLGDHFFQIRVNDTSNNQNLSPFNQFTIISPSSPVMDFVQIRNQPNGNGEIIKNMSYMIDDIDYFYAAGYNHTYGYIGDFEVSWASNNENSGVVNPLFGISTVFTALSPGSGSVFVISGFIQNSTTFEVLAAQSPEITGTIPDINLLEDFGLYQIDLYQFASDPQDSKTKLKWYLTGADFSIFTTAGENQTGNHIISLVSKENMYGKTKVKYWLLDSDGNSAFQEAWINISPKNDPPNIEGCPNLFLHFDSPYSFDYSPYITDVDNEFSELILTCNDTIHSSVTGLTVTYDYPKSMENRGVYVILKVSDGQNSDSELIKINITSDYPPIGVDNLPDVTIFENETKLAVFDLDDYITDPDGDSLYMSYGYTHLDITIHDNHTVDISAIGEWSGVEKVIFRAQDPTGAILEQTINVTVLPVNDPPVIKVLPNLKVHYNHPYLFDLFWYITDSDNKIEELTISTSNPNNVSVTGTSLILTFPEYWEGKRYPYNVSLTVFVSDDQDISISQTTVFVDDDFPPRMLYSLDDVFFYEDEVLYGIYDLDDYFTDDDGDTIFYTSGNINIIVSIHENHTIDFAAAPNWFGSEYITIRATDFDGAFAEDTILVTILPVNDPPSITEIPPQIGERGKLWILDLREFVSDVDNKLEDLNISVDSSYVTVVDYMLIFDYPENITEDIIQITVSDGELTTTLPVKITIKSVPATPDEEPWFLYLVLIFLTAILITVLIARRGFYTVEDIFLITHSGLLIAHVGGESEEGKDDDVLASMFVAVQEFVKDAFTNEADEERENLNRMDYGNKKVLIYMGDKVRLSTFLSGQATKSFYKRMEDFVEDVEEKYEAVLNKDILSIEDFSEIEDMMLSLLNGNYSKGYWK